MTDFLRKPFRFVCRGISLNRPVDDPRLVAEGKFPILINARSNQDGSIENRPGLTGKSATSSAASDKPVRSVRRLNDVANATFTRIVGAGTKLFYGSGLSLSAAATGFSGDPLALVPYQPDQSPDPWMYVGDRSRMAKIRSDGLTQSVGIAPPTSEPTASLGAAATLDVDTFQATTNWAADNAVLDNTGLSVISRFSTTVTAAIGDVAGSGAGWYTIAPADLANILPGTFVTFGTTGGSSKFVQTVRPAAFTTTVGAITYDAGTSGLCSIQPVAAVDISVDAMVQLAGAEYVRVQSVTLAPDGTVQSFRASTVGTITVTQAIAGVSSFRAYCDAAPTGTINHSALRAKFLTSAGGVGTITKTSGLANSNVGVVGARQVLDMDEIHVSLRLSNLNELVEGKLLLNVDPSDTTFTQNAYVWTFRPSDLQATVTNATTTLSGLASNLTNTIITTQGGGDNSGDSGGSAFRTDNPMFADITDTGTGDNSGGDVTGVGTGGTSVVATFDTLGQAQWFELRFKIKDATRIGTAAGRTLQTISGIRISLNCTATVNTDTVDFDAWWVGGTFGPDVGDIGTPYCYRTRGRSSLTGARSNPSPAMRPGGGISPRRQSVAVSFANLRTASDASWAQVDKIDVYRFGGSLNAWFYVGTVTNDPAAGATTLTFADNFPDDWVASQPLLDFDQDQPFPVVDKPRSGTCNVSGTWVTRVSGDIFNANWPAGTTIAINGVNYSFHNRPVSSSKLEIEEDGGSQTAVAWTISAPVILGQPLPALWGPLDNFMFACGDPLNPGRLYWMNGNNPDAAQQGNFLDVTTPSEPLMNGCMWDGRAFVWSTDRMFAIYPTFEGAILTGSEVIGGGPTTAVPFRVLEIPNSQGLYTRWGFCVGPKMWFIGKDGIYETTGGEPASITDADLYPWFPNEGNAGQTVNGIFAPDLTYTSGTTSAKDFRLAWHDDYLYFDYRNSIGSLGSATYRTTDKSWWLDSYGVAVVMHYGEEGTKDGFSSFPGAAIESLLAGGTDTTGIGTLYQCAAGVDDQGSAITVHVRTPSVDADEPWLDKLHGDIVVDLNCGNQTVTVTPGFNNYGVTAPALTTTSAGRAQVIVPVNSGTGQIARNVALDVTWSASGPSIVSALLYLWEPSLWPHSYLQKNWTTPESANGLINFGHLRDGYVAHISTADLTVTVTIDGVDYAYTIPHGGGAYRRTYFVLQPVKGKSRKYTFTSTAPFRLLTQDTSFALKEWASQQGYLHIKPFGEAWPT